MKAFLFCVCVLVLASFSLADIKQQLKKVLSSINEDVAVCITENNYVSGDWYSEPQIVNNLHLQPRNEQRTRRCGCTIACVLKRQDMLEGSNIKELKIHEAIDNTIEDNTTYSKIQIHKIVHKCVKEVKDITEECEEAFSLYVCIAKAAHVLRGHGEHEPEQEEGKQE